MMEMKVINFQEKKARKIGDYSPKDVIDHLSKVADDIEHIVYITQAKDGTINVWTDTMLKTQSLGLLKLGERIMIDDMLEE
jgi:hypothetical protein